MIDVKSLFHSSAFGGDFEPISSAVKPLLQIMPHHSFKFQSPSITWNNFLPELA